MNVKTILFAVATKVMALRHFPLRKTIGITIASLMGLILLGIIGFAVFLSSFDVNSYKPQIAAAVKKVTGREFTVQGNMSVSFFPTLGIRTGKAVLHDVPGFGPAPFLTLQNASFAIGFKPFLSGKMDVERIALYGPTLKLATNAQGEHNWEARLPASAGSSPANSSSPASPHSPAAGAPGGFSIHLKRLIVGEVKISYTNDQDDTAWSGTLNGFTFNMSQPGTRQPVELSGQMKDERSAKNAAFSVKAGIEVKDADSLALHFDSLEIVARGYTRDTLTVTSAGTLLYDRSPGAATVFSGFSGTVHMPAPVITRVDETAVPLSETPAEGSGEEPPALAAPVETAVQEEDAKEFLVSFSDGALEYLPGTDGAAPVWKGKASLSELDMDDLLGRISSGYAAFIGETVRGAPNLSRPVIGKSVRGMQISEALRITARVAPTADQAPAKQAEQDQPAAPPSEQAAEGPAQQPADSAAPAPQTAGSAKQRFATVNCNITADTVIFKNMPFKQVEALVHSRAGRTEAHCTSRLFNGSFSCAGSIDYNETKPKLALTATASGVRLEEATRLLADTFVVTGKLEASLTVTGVGNSFSEIANSLQGKASARVPAGGDVRGFAMVPSHTREARFVPREFKYEALLASADISEGIASCKEITMLSRAVAIRGGGKIHFAYGQVDFGLDIALPGKYPIPIVISGPYRSLSNTIATRQGRYIPPDELQPPAASGFYKGGMYPPPRQRETPYYETVRPPARAPSHTPRRRSNDILRDAGGMLFR